MKRIIALALATLVMGARVALAADTATVTEAVNDVSHGSAEAAKSAPAKAGTVIPDGEYVKTGALSRAELSLANQSITRLGANTIFNYSAASNEADLQAGTILFSKPKDGKEMTIKTASVTAAIVGTTGFISLKDKVFIFGLVEGHAKVNTAKDGVNHEVNAGQILRFTADGHVELLYFNVPRFLKTSPLLAKFKSTLPNQPYIDAEVKRYDDFAAKGFVGPPTESYVINGVVIPILPVTAHDSASMAQKMFIAPPSAMGTNGFGP